MHRVFKRTAAIAAGCLFAATALAERSYISNSVKYKDSSLPKATGRSGNATIEAQALLDKSGVTMLEVTSNGSLDKVQVKIPTTGDDVTLNYPNLGAGSTFSTVLDDLARHTRLGVQANVSGVDASRTGVVSAEETVKLRPDLDVVSVSVPPHASIETPVRVTALVRERNGDVGARADCVLYAGNVEVRRATGIWVDAGGAVTCAFAALFDTPGEQNLRVALENVAPGDFDTANNSAAASTRLYDHAEPFPEWNTWCQEFSGSEVSQTTSAAETRYRSSYDTRQVSTLSASFTGPMNLENLTVTAAVSTDGELLYSADQFEMEYDWFEPEIFGDLVAISLHGNGFDGLIWGRNRGPNQRTTVDLRRVGGDVTYHTYGFERQWDGSYYTWNETGSYSLGTISRPYGDTVSMTMSISDGTTLWEQNQSHMPLNPYDSVYSWSFCDDSRYYGLVCESLSADIHGRWGFDYPPHQP